MLVFYADGLYGQTERKMLDLDVAHSKQAVLVLHQVDGVKIFNSASAEIGDISDMADCTMKILQKPTDKYRIQVKWKKLNNYQSDVRQNFWQNIWIIFRRIFNVKPKMLSDLMLILTFLLKWMAFRPSVVVTSLNLFRLTRLHFQRLLKRHYFRELNSPNFMRQIQGFWKRKVVFFQNSVLLDRIKCNTPVWKTIIILVIYSQQQVRQFLILFRLHRLGGFGILRMHRKIIPLEISASVKLIRTLDGIKALLIISIYKVRVLLKLLTILFKTLVEKSLINPAIQFRDIFGHPRIFSL